MEREKFDQNTFFQDFDKEYNTVAEEPKVEAEAPDTPVEQEPEPESSVKEEETVETEVAEESTEDVPEIEKPVNDISTTIEDPDTHKRNEAFKKLREERDQYSKSDKFLSDLASQYGISKDELIQKIQDDRAKKEAAKQGIPVEQYKRIQSLEEQVRTMQERYTNEAFNMAADNLIRKYNIPSTDVDNLFRQIANTGFDVLHNPNLLEFAFKAINYDKALEKGRQDALSQTKKRRETSVGSLGTKGAQVDSTAEDMDREIDDYLKKHVF